MMSTGLPLRLEGVSKRYGKFAALTPTDLTVVAGQFLTLLGPSGSGKTTLLNLIAGYPSRFVQMGHTDLLQERLNLLHDGIRNTFIAAERRDTYLPPKTDTKAQ